MPDALGLTPSQTAGPYLSIGLLRDLVPTELVEPGDSRAIHVRGRLLDGAGEGIPDGMVEIWQADRDGRYGTDAFQGFGRSGTVDAGRFEFVTVKPGRVSWPEGGLQAPHLAVGVFARGLLKRVVTRLYFPDEPSANDEDPVLSALSPAQREALVAVPDDDGLRFDIHLQGPSQTTFFAV
jgi:protocatechuate 3,4-dioxygenase, alpha subunit